MTQDLEQGSDAWKEARKDKLTASTFAAAIGLNPHKSKQALYREIVGIDPPFEGNEMTEYGTEHEPDARHAYEVHTGEVVEETGFWVHPETEWLGASPDGLINPGGVNDDGIVEFKCRYNGELWDKVPDYYMPQIQGQLVITNKLFCDFVSWAPGGLAIFRVPIVGKYWATMWPLLDKFHESVINMEQPKRAKKPVMPEVNYKRIL